MILFVLFFFFKYFHCKKVYFLSLFKEPTLIFDDRLYFIFILVFINFSQYFLLFSSCFPGVYSVFCHQLLKLDALIINF